MNWTSAIEEWILSNPLPLGDSWDITRMSSTEIKIGRNVSVAFFYACEVDSQILVIGKDMLGKTYHRQIVCDLKTSEKLIVLIKRFCSDRV
jgi:hypothetical protein